MTDAMNLGALIVSALCLTIALVNAGLTVAFLLDWRTDMLTAVGTTFMTAVFTFLFLAVLVSALP